MAVITRTALHVITWGVCNQDRALQAVITADSCNQALQDGPVITCNRGSVIGPLVIAAENAPICALPKRYRESIDSTPPSLSGQTNVEDHGCCSPHDPAEWVRRTDRLRAAQQRVRADQPTTCPVCQSPRVFPTFEGEGWACGDCAVTWDAAANDDTTGRQCTDGAAERSER